MVALFRVDLDLVSVQASVSNASLKQMLHIYWRDSATSFADVSAFRLLAPGRLITIIQ